MSLITVDYGNIGGGSQFYSESKSTPSSSGSVTFDCGFEPDYAIAYVYADTTHRYWWVYAKENVSNAFIAAFSDGGTNAVVNYSGQNVPSLNGNVLTIPVNSSAAYSKTMYMYASKE